MILITNVLIFAGQSNMQGKDRGAAGCEFSKSDEVASRMEKIVGILGKCRKMTADLPF